MTKSTSFHVEELCIYPLKSAQATTLQEVQICIDGFQYDRMYALINEEHTVLTGREYPQLLSIKTKLIPIGIQFSAPGRRDIQLNLENSDKVPVEAQLFREPFQALIIKDAVNAWFSEVLGIKCYLILNDPKTSRKVRHSNENNPIRLSDASPIHLINQNSINDLNKRLQNKVESTRFRPNIVISGVAPYEEENWKELRIGACRFKVILKTARCSMINIIAETQQKDPDQEPLRELANYKKADHKINFGIYLIPLQESRITNADVGKVL